MLRNTCSIHELFLLVNPHAEYHPPDQMGAGEAQQPAFLPHSPDIDGGHLRIPDASLNGKASSLVCLDADQQGICDNRAQFPLA